MLDRASNLRGIAVVSGDEGAQLGTLSALYVDTDKNRIAAIGYRTRRIGGDELYVLAADIQTLGRDVVLVSGERVARRITGATKAPGRNLKALQGSWVTTMDGHHLGTVMDLHFKPDDWSITTLVLGDETELPVDASEIKIGDEILVPASYAERLGKAGAPKHGFMRRLFGGASPSEPKRRHEAHERQEKKAG